MPAAGCRQVLGGLLALALLAVAPTTSSANVPGANGRIARAKPPVLGVVSQDKLAARDFERMERGGVRTVRFLLFWSAAEPEPGRYEWRELDRLAELAARHRVELLPFIWGSPAWMYGNGSRPPLAAPADREAWQRFLTALVARYGRGGEFWRSAAVRGPIKRWQIWNEPNFEFYWAPPIDPAGYAELLRLAAAPIRAADPRAEIVAGGVAPVAAGMPWKTFLTRFYAVAGVREQFDYLALHPYAARVEALLGVVEGARGIMAAAGDARTPLAITEIGWASGGPSSAPMVLGRKGQARRLRRALTELRGYPRKQISDVQWYAWQDSQTGEYLCTFCRQAGLFGLDRRPKPAWDAYRRLATTPRRR